MSNSNSEIRIGLSILSGIDYTLSSVTFVSDSPVLPASEITKGQMSKVIDYNEEMFTPCAIAMTLNQADLVAGVTYTIAIDVYNQNGNYYLTTGQEVTVQVISIPTPGTLQVCHQLRNCFDTLKLY